MDFSEPMLEQARARIRNLGESDRVSILSGDLSTSNWMESLPVMITKGERAAVEEKQTVDLVVSSFAIHHLVDQRKQELYQEIYDLLSPGGIFLNLEHVASPDPTVEKIFDGAFAESMYQHFQGTKTYEECERAVDYDLNVDAEANLLVPVEKQCDWLREIGFQHVDCYFKFLIIAMFGGVKK